MTYNRIPTVEVRDSESATPPAARPSPRFNPTPSLQSFASVAGRCVILVPPQQLTIAPLQSWAIPSGECGAEGHYTQIHLKKSSLLARGDPLVLPTKAF